MGPRPEPTAARKYDRVVRLLWPAVLTVTLALGTTACGATTKARTPPPGAKTPQATAAAAIKARLKEAGYAVYHQQLVVPVYLGLPGRPGTSVQRQSIVPPGTPTPAAAFWTQVDFASANNSFQLTVWVFPTHGQAVLAAKNTETAARNSLATCLKQPLCRARRPALLARCTKSPACLRQVRRADQRSQRGPRQRVIGLALYSAYVTTTKSANDFNTLVTLAAKPAQK
jgi:hypothetical protein